MNDSPSELTGLVGFAADLIAAAGEWGVGLFTLVETVFPPIPSEVILPLAGYLVTAGGLSIPLLVVTSVLGSTLGALLLYWLGAAFGLERSIRGLSHLPLLDRADFEKAADWFSRHGRAAVFFGRLVPGVRSLISLPAGAERMNLLTFIAFTVAGSGIWNTVLILLGAALGTKYQLVEQYSRYLNYALYAAISGVIVWLVVRRVRANRGGANRGGANRPGGR